MYVCRLWSVSVRRALPNRFFYDQILRIPRVLMYAYGKFQRFIGIYCKCFMLTDNSNWGTLSSSHVS